MTDEERTMKALSREQFAEVMNLLLSKSKEELEQVLESPDLPYFMEMSIRFLFEMKYDEFDKLLNRLIGKVKDELELTGGVGSLSHKSLSELKSEAAQLHGEIQKADGK